MTEARAASFLRRLVWLYVAACVGVAAEIAVALHRAPPGALSLSRAVVAFAGSQAFALVLAGALALFMTGVAALARALREAGVIAPARHFERSDLGAALLVTLPLTVTLGASIILAFGQHFRNRELAALFAAALVVALTVLGILATAALALAMLGARRRLAPNARKRAFVLRLPGVAVLGALVLLDRHAHVTGVSQLDGWLLAPPIAAALSAIALRAPRAARVLGAAAAPASMLTTALALGVFSVAWPASAAAELARYGAWSRLAVPALRALTDRDGDGYSAWFAGGDCDDTEPSVHPGAPEIPGNGVDDNCAGGDGQASPVSAPEASGIRFFPADPPMNLVLVTIETLRADHVSFLGYSRPTTPRLAELAARSVVFERLYANTPTTRLSLPSLLSGTLASHIDWQRQAPEKHMRRIGPRTPWLPELLRAEGYATIAVHASFRAFTALESAGFDRGFDHYDVSTELVYRGGTMQGFPGEQQVDRALALIHGVSGRPFFLWVHLLEPHYLYEQPPLAPRFGTSERDLYDAEIAETDRQIGRLLDGLAHRGALARSVVLVTGDHGEEFGEHGERWHTSNLYEPQVHTAGLLFAPGVEPRRVRTPVVLTDFAPTLLDLLDKPAALSRMQGRNLAPLLRSGDRPLSPFFLENFRVNDGRAYQAAVLAWPYKLITREDGGLLELYDVQGDPGERQNLYAQNLEVGQALRNLLDRLRESRPAP